MGAGLPPFFKDKIDIFLDPEEAQVLLEKRLAERHVEYNELSLTTSRLREEISRFKKQVPGEKDESVKLQETTEQKRKLEEKLRERTNEANTLRSQQQKLESELQESEEQRQRLLEHAADQRKLEEKLQEKANEANTTKQLKENLERALQESKNQSQNADNEAAELRKKYERSEKELRRLQSHLMERKPPQWTTLS